jgi:hypothetical protein
MTGNLSVILICISLTKDVKHFFHVFLDHLHFCFGELFDSFVHLLIGLLVLLVFNFLSSLYILDVNHLSDE